MTVPEKEPGETGPVSKTKNRFRYVQCGFRPLGAFFWQHVVRNWRFQVSVFSPAAGQKDGRSNRKRNSKKANIE